MARTTGATGGMNAPASAGDDDQHDGAAVGFRRHDEQGVHRRFAHHGRTEHAEPAEAVHQPAEEWRAGGGRERLRADRETGGGVGVGRAAHEQEDGERRHPLRKPGDERGGEQPRGAGLRQH